MIHKDGTKYSKQHYEILIKIQIASSFSFGLLIEEAENKNYNIKSLVNIKKGETKSYIELIWSKKNDTIMIKVDNILQKLIKEQIINDFEQSQTTDLVWYLYFLVNPSDILEFYLKFIK